MVTTRQERPGGRRLATIQEAAEYCQVGQRTLRRWISDGRVKAYRVGPRFVRVDLNELDAGLWEIPSARAR